MIEIEIKKKLGNLEIDVAFNAGHDNVTAIYGQSGAGKTSLINIIAGLLDADSGRIIFDGEVIYHSEKNINIPAQNRHIGYVFQDGRLFPHLSVRKNLLYGINRNKDKNISEVDEISTLFGIKHLLDRYPKMLSGGEKQRVAIARALLSNPKILLMDEPLASLDKKRSDELLEYLMLVHEKFKIPILYVTHSQYEIKKIADNILIMDDGKLIEFKKSDEF